MPIKIEELSVCFGNKKVLDHFSHEFPETGVACINGPSGCGKTTLVRVIAGLIQPEKGEVTGVQKGEISMMFQEDRLFPWLTARENIEIVQIKTGAYDWLEAVGLSQEAGTKPDGLSGGMRRRVALARALSYPAKLLILDESFKGLDQKSKQDLYPLIRQSSKDRLVILISHDRDEISYLADMVYQVQGIPLKIISTEISGKSEKA